MEVTVLRGLVWIFVLETTLAGCVMETDLARRDLPASTVGDAPGSCPGDGDLCAADAGEVEAQGDAGVATDGMAGGMDGSMKCDGHDCDAAPPADGGSSMMEW